MKKHIFILSLLLTGLVRTLQAQTLPDSLRDHIWVLGAGCDDTIPFLNSTLMIFTDTGPVLERTCKKLLLLDTNSSICNLQGDLEFNSNGIGIADTSNNYMDGSYETLRGDSFNYWSFLPEVSPQSLLTLPYPDHTGLYYVIHEYYKVVYSTGNPYADTLNYSVVDMAGHGGLGSIIDLNHFIKKDSFDAGQITACRHANGRDWWIIVPGYANNKYHTLLLDNTGLHDSGIQQVGPVYAAVTTFGQAVFSPNGETYLRYSADRDTGSCPLSVFSFDRCTGTLSLRCHSRIPIDSANGVGAAISPNGRYAYLTDNTHLYQYDLHALNIPASRVVVGIYDGFYNPNIVHLPTYFYLEQLAPDGKIYMSTNAQSAFLHVINHPDLPQEACDFRQHAIALPTFNAFTIPNYPYFRLGALAGSGCDTILGVRSVGGKEKGVSIYPNPGNDYITLKPKQGTLTGEVQLVDILGNTVYTTTVEGVEQLSIDTHKIGNGTYICQLKNGTTNLSQKIIILH